jgi:hypothetical protein
MTVLFHLGVFLSSALGFSLQLILARLLLPETGGLPIVWIVCTFFFQATVIFSYLYAQYLGRIPPLRQFLVHGSLLAFAGALFLPLQYSTEPHIWQYGTVLGILLVLAANVGLPFLLLSSHTVILAGWLRQTVLTSNPYRLFATANAGSLAVLLLYPFAFEPLWNLVQQMVLWNVGFVLVTGLVIIFGIRLLHQPKQLPRPAEPTLAPVNAKPGQVPVSAMVSIILASALSCVIFLSATSYFSIVLFPVSLLWILPFGMYLAAWIIAFAGPPHLRHQQRVLSILPFVFLNLAPMPVAFLIVLNTLLVGIVCLGLHSFIAGQQYYFSQPGKFYAIISIGGLLGNIVVILLSHIISPAYIYPLAILASPLVIPLASLLPWLKNQQALYRRRLTYALVLAATLFWLIDWTSDESGRRLWGKTDLFGAVRVTECPETRTRRLLLNEVIQGQENTSNPNFSYYGWLQELRTSLFPSERPVSWIGLGMGVGTMVTAAQPSDRVHFFEVNPSVVYAAQHYFSYLKQSPAWLNIEIGDGRKLLEQVRGTHDIIVGDAYAGGSIPQHMMTREFFQLCADRLSPEGIIAVHVSHRALRRLGPVVMAMGESLGFSPWLLEVEADQTNFASFWVLLVRPESLARYGEKLRDLGATPASGNGSIWTDQYSPVWQAW